MFRDLITEFDLMDVIQLLKGFLGLSFMSWVVYKFSLVAGLLGAGWVVAQLYEDFFWMFEPEMEDDEDDDDKGATA